MSSAYWEARYRDGGTSGEGSTGGSAVYKARFLNDFVHAHHVKTVVEFGCGDGHQLRLAQYPDYLGLDVSETAIALCRELFADDPLKQFALLPYHVAPRELALSLDVIYHLVEDDVYERHLDDLFNSASRFVVLYTTDMDEDPLSAKHVRHRHVTRDIEWSFVDWQLTWTEQLDLIGRCRFLVYERAP